MTIIAIHITVSADPTFPVSCVLPSSGPIYEQLLEYASLASDDDHTLYTVAAISLTFLILRDEEPDSFSAPIVNSEAVLDTTLGLLVITNQVPALLTRSDPAFRLAWAKYSAANQHPTLSIVRERDSVLYYRVTSQFGAIQANEDD